VTSTRTSSSWEENRRAFKGGEAERLRRGANLVANGRKFCLEKNHHKEGVMQVGRNKKKSGKKAACAHSC